jgi:hypothetical protein
MRRRHGDMLAGGVFGLAVSFVLRHTVVLDTISATVCCDSCADRQEVGVESSGRYSLF